VELKEATRGSVMVLLLKDLSSILVSNKGCKLQRKDFKLLSDRFNAPTFSLLALHLRHRKRTTMHKMLVCWDRAIVVVRMGTMLTGVQGSSQIRLQLLAQTRTSTAVSTIVQLLQQGKIKLVPAIVDSTLVRGGLFIAVVIILTMRVLVEEPPCPDLKGLESGTQELSC
jgi:hypothetical protein